MTDRLLIDALKQSSFPILFLGAGFSSNARNRSGLPIPTGGQLSSILQSDLGLVKRYELDVLAREYIFQKGENILYDLLIDRLNCGSTNESIDTIVSQDWKRIYTTNYDNVVDYSLSKSNRTISSYSCISNSVSDIQRIKRSIIHINGRLFKSSPLFAEPIDFRVFSDEITLTRASYLSDRFVGSPWHWLFKSDLSVASYVVVVGYSAYDLDIARIIYTNGPLI